MALPRPPRTSFVFERFEQNSATLTQHRTAKILADRSNGRLNTVANFYSAEKSWRSLMRRAGRMTIGRQGGREAVWSCCRQVLGWHCSEISPGSNNVVTTPDLIRRTNNLVMKPVQPRQQQESRVVRSPTKNKPYTFQAEQREASNQPERSILLISIPSPVLRGIGSCMFGAAPPP